MKKAFTVIEIVIVVLLIWLISSALWAIFSYDNVSSSKFDTCYLRVISQMDKFFQESLLQKLVYDWSNLTGVIQYDIKFNQDEQKIVFLYSWANVKKIFQLSWNWYDAKHDCFSAKYKTMISGWNLRVSLRPWLGVDNKIQWNAWMSLYTWNNFNSLVPMWESKDIYFSFCFWSWTSSVCEEKYKLTVDSKVQLFNKYICQKNDSSTRECLKWGE